jgi:hypothetical protein
MASRLDESANAATNERTECRIYRTLHTSTIAVESKSGDHRPSWLQSVTFARALMFQVKLSYEASSNGVLGCVGRVCSRCRMK